MIQIRLSSFGLHSLTKLYKTVRTEKDNGTASGIAREKHPRKKNTVENDNQTERQQENRGGIKHTEGNGRGSGSKRNQVIEMKEKRP